MTHRYAVSGTGYILDNGEVLERQSLRTPQDAVAELLNKQAERIAELQRESRNWQTIADGHRDAAVKLKAERDQLQNLVENQAAMIGSNLCNGATWTSTGTTPNTKE